MSDLKTGDIAVDDFNWFDDPSIVQKEVPALAVYANRSDQIVIRQERGSYDEEDPIVRIDPRNAKLIAKVILDIAAQLADAPTTPKRRLASPGAASQPLPGLLAAE